MNYCGKAWRISREYMLEIRKPFCGDIHLQFSPVKTPENFLIDEEIRLVFFLYF